jgi:hypothetical protein
MFALFSWWCGVVVTVVEELWRCFFRGFVGGFTSVRGWHMDEV